ncbi:MAG: hypothetical protein HYS27_02880 [Deltaproteobacteria bacterium]|nr:hypothetical protein [Deltaproteobacteria bacterium]
MVTKADDYRREQQAKQRKKTAKPKKPKKAKRRDVDTAAPGVSATDVKRGERHTADRNRSMHAERKASVVLEDSESGKPSRKSSRKSANRLKMAAGLEKEAARRLNTPKAKATRAKARAR